MIKRKAITLILATILTITCALVFVYGEWERPLELLTMIGIFSIMFSPFFLLYGVPITFFSDYITKRFTGAKRVISALIVHLFFGMGFAFIFVFITETRHLIRDFKDYWGNGMDEFFIAASVGSFFFWAIDEVLRNYIKGTTIDIDSIKKYWKEKLSSSKN